MSTWPWPPWIAHRAAGCGPLENTLAGVRAAAAHGFTAIEIDVQLSADLRPVVIHDETLLRTTGHPGRVDERTAAELGRLAIPPDPAGDEGIGGIIPELGEVLVVAADLGLAVNIELKAGRSSAGTLSRAVLDCLDQLWWALAGSPLLLSSFDHQELRSVRGARPDLALALLSETAAEWDIQRARQLDAIALHVAAEQCDAAAVQRLQAAGLDACAWTVNEMQQAQALFALGVRSVFTDRLPLAAETRSG